MQYFENFSGVKNRCPLVKLTLEDTINNAANISNSSIAIAEREFLFDFNDVVEIFSTNHKKVVV